MHRLRHQMEQCHVLFLFSIDRVACCFFASHFNSSFSVHVMEVSMPCEWHSSIIAYQQYVSKSQHVPLQCTNSSAGTDEILVLYCIVIQIYSEYAYSIVTCFVFHFDLYASIFTPSLSLSHTFKIDGRARFMQTSFAHFTFRRWKISAVDKYCKSTKHSISKMY